MLFNLVLLYVFVYYYQPGGRIPALGAIRFELLLGIVILFAIFTQKSAILLKLDRMNKAILMFFVAMCLSFFGAVYTHTASHAIDVFIEVLKCCAWYLMIIGTIDTERKLKIFMLVYIACIIMYFTEPFILSLKGEGFRYEGGVTHLFGVGQFAHYNELGANTAINLAFLFQLFLYYKNWIVKGVLLLFSIVGLRVIILTGSRSAYITVIALCIFIALFSKHRIRNIIIGVVLLITLYNFMPQEYQERFATLQETTSVIKGEEIDGSIHSRWVIMQDAWDVFLQYPLFGVGLDSFYQVRGILFNRWQQAHNLYLQLLSDLGVVGFVAFLVLICNVFAYLAYVRTIKDASSNKRDYVTYLSVGVSIYLCTKLAAGLFGHALYANYWWISAGIAKVIYELVKKESTNNIINK